MIKKLIKDIIKGEGGFNKGEDISPKSEGIPKKARVSPIPLLRGGCVKSKNQVFFDILYKKDFISLLC